MFICRGVESEGTEARLRRGFMIQTVADPSDTDRVFKDPTIVLLTDEFINRAPTTSQRSNAALEFDTADG